MKHLFTFALALFALSLSFSAQAQAPQGLSYQAVARDVSGQFLPNQEIGLRISILNSTSSGPVVYQETFNPKTNGLGLFTLEIGYGTVTSGNFDAINWGGGLKFLKVEMDPTGGTNYTDLGTTQLMSVPYALYSSKAGNPLIGGSGIKISNDTVINISPDQKIVLTGSGNTKITGTYPDFNVYTDIPPSYSTGTGLSLSGTTFSAQNTTALWNANQLQGNMISTTAPTNKQVLKWNSTAGDWEPAVDSTTIYSAGVGIAINGTTISSAYTGGNGINISNGIVNSVWTLSGNNISNNNSGKVGIGKSPSYSLDVYGPVDADSLMLGGITMISDKGFNNVLIGQNAGYKNYGNDNYFSGFEAGYGNTSGYQNCFAGYEAGYNNISGANNQFEGYLAGYNNTTGSGNYFSGNGAGYNCRTGIGITAVGNSAGALNTSGSDNTFIGTDADATANGLTNATAIGYEATVSKSNSLVLGYNANVGIGTSTPSNLLSVGTNSAFQIDVNGNIVKINSVAYSFPANQGNSGQVLFNNGSGVLTWGNAPSGAGNGITISSGLINSTWTVSGTNINNNNTGYVGIGKSPSYSLDVKGPLDADSVMLGSTTMLSAKGTSNIFIGQKVGNKNTGSYNYFSGNMSGYYNTTGSTNQFVGYEAGYSNTTGASNECMGYQSGYKNTTGTQNTFIGYSAGYTNATGNGNTALGYNAGTSYAYSDCTFMGLGADANVTGLSNATSIGYNAVVGTSNTMAFGNSSVTSWAFGIPKVTNTATTYALQVGSTSSNGNGAYLTATGTWTNVSDRNKKENFTVLDAADVLNRICRLPVTRWNYKGEQIINTHIGPMAQDFYKLFHTGNDSLAISTIDPAGVALVGVQELEKQNEALKSKLEMLERQNAAQEVKIDSMASEMDEIKALLKSNAPGNNAGTVDLSVARQK